MADAPTLNDLKDGVVVLTDPGGRKARFVVEKVSGTRALCAYVFRSQQKAPVTMAGGDRVELGSSSPVGWISAKGNVVTTRKGGIVVVDVDSVELIQRRRAYREDVTLPLTLRERMGDVGHRGRTDNISIGGFAARIDGKPVQDGAQVIVGLDMPDGQPCQVNARKIAGDIRQRFQFINLDRKVEDRFAKLVREAEIRKRRGGTARG